MKSTNNAEKKRGTILVVDDDPAVLSLIQAILAAANYRVVAAARGDDAVRLTKQRHLHLDAALLDVHMPGLRPAELAREILSLRPKLPIVFMSGLLDNEVIRIRVLEDSAGFVPKPFTGPCLLWAVRQAMKTPQPATLVASA